MSSLEKIIKNCAGIDIGSEKVFVAIEGEEVRSFRTFTRTYKELGFYMREHGITHVAMEATGIYWITLYDILEAMGFDVCLVNPADSKNLPGRKTFQKSNSYCNPEILLLINFPKKEKDFQI